MYGELIKTLFQTAGHWLIGQLPGLVLGFLGGLGTIAVSFGTNWASDKFKQKEEKRKNVEKFMGKVTDVIAIATKERYTNRQNRVDKRGMDRAAFQLRRLGKKKLAKNIENYTEKWKQVYDIVSSVPAFSDGRLPFKLEDDAKNKLTSELDILTKKIIG